MVGWATAFFVLVLISGLVLWSPRRWNKTLVRSRLTVKWKAGENRRIYDLHNTLGFYISLLAVIIAFIGLTWSFPPLAKGYYRMLTNRELLEWNLPVSDTTQRTGQSNVAQKLWKRHCAMIPQKGRAPCVSISPRTKAVPIWWSSIQTITGTGAKYIGSTINIVAICSTAADLTPYRHQT